MAKTKAQIEKHKRETEKRKKTEKAILKKAAGMPDGSGEQTPASPNAATTSEKA